jgi:chaperonin cofactor prefoldin
VAPQRKQSVEEIAQVTTHPAVVAETLRLAQPPADDGKGEEKVSVFWKLFGGTLLSIAALVVVTVYQQVSGALAELRANHARVKDGLAELARKDELTQRTASLWASVKETNAEVPALKTRAAQLEAQVRGLDQERKELQERLQKLSERVAKLEGRRAPAPSAKAATAPKPPKVMPEVD